MRFFRVFLVALLSGLGLLSICISFGVGITTKFASELSCQAGPAVWCSSSAPTSCLLESRDYVCTQAVTAVMRPHVRSVQAHSVFTAEAKRKGSRVRVLFLGDSTELELLSRESGICIFEWWRGRESGRLKPDFHRYRTVFHRWFGTESETQISGVSGDETQHLLWRIMNGELDHLSPKVVVLMIGINNIGVSRMNGSDVVAGIAALVRYLRFRLPESHIVVMAILPDGNCTLLAWMRETEYCLSEHAGELPSPVSSAVEDANAQLRRMYGSVGQIDPMIQFLDCTRVVLKDEHHIDPLMLPDFLHPSVEGYDALAKDCISPAVQGYLAADT